MVRRRHVRLTPQPDATEPTSLDSRIATVEVRGVRLRQVVIAARDLEETVAHLTGIFGLDVCFRDPAVAEFGLVNAVMPVGDTFLEVVSPVAGTAPARRARPVDGGPRRAAATGG